MKVRRQLLTIAESVRIPLWMSLLDSYCAPGLTSVCVLAGEKGRG